MARMQAVLTYVTEVDTPRPLHPEYAILLSIVSSVITMSDLWCGVPDVGALQNCTFAVRTCVIFLRCGIIYQLDLIFRRQA